MSKKQSENKETFEKFPLKKTAAITWLSVAALLLSVAGIIVSSIRLYKNGVHSIYDSLESPFMIVICIFAIVIICALFIHSEYRVSDKELIACYGFIKNRTPLSDITSATSDVETNKIYLTFSSTEGQLTLKTSPDKRENLILAMLKGNPSIDYSFSLREKKDEEK